METHWYFAYGSNLDINQMERRIGKVGETHRACLIGYRIVFNKLGSDGTGKANICPDMTHVVWGVAYRCSQNALDKMDRYEGISDGHYLRRDVQVLRDSGEMLAAVTYVAGEGYVQSSLEPAPDYLDRIITGAGNHGLPVDYIQEIQRAARDVE